MKLLFNYFSVVIILISLLSASAFSVNKNSQSQASLSTSKDTKRIKETTITNEIGNVKSYREGNNTETTTTSQVVSNSTQDNNTDHGCTQKQWYNLLSKKCEDIKGNYTY